MIAFDDAPFDAIPNLVREGREAVSALKGSLQNYQTEVLQPDPKLIQSTQTLLDDLEFVVAHSEQQWELRPLIERAGNEAKELVTAREAYNIAQTTTARAAAASTYRDVIDKLMITHAALKADGRADPEFLSDLGDMVDEAGQNLAKIANLAHVAAVSPKGDAHDLAWAAPAKGKTLAMNHPTRYAKPVGTGAIALLVAVAGVWIGSSGGESAPSPVVAPAIAPATIPAPATVPVAPPVVAPRVAPSVSSVPVAPVKPIALAPVKAPAPAVVKPVAAPIEHRAPVVHHADTRASEQAQINAANAKLDAWAQQHDH